MNEEVKALKSELALLKLQFSQRIDVVESRLNDLLAPEKTSAEHQSLASTQVEEAVPENAAKISRKTTAPQPTAITTQAYIASINEPKAPAKPSIFTLFLRTLFAALFDWFAPLSKIYHSYKARGMLGIFMLTVVGIGLTVAGFGYLMQLLIDQLGAGAKSLFICGAAISVMALGITLKIKTRFSEFATAIVTLGILLFYSTVYFSGSVYGLIPNFAILILYLAIALSCHILALYLDTKVVAALGIIGIATMPILSNTISIEPLYYLWSLIFVVSSSLFLAYRYLGQWLAQLSLAFTLVSLEWLIGVENIQLSVSLVNLFYLLFFGYITLTLVKEKAPTQQSLVFLVALAGSSVLIFLQASDIFTSKISVIFAFNALLTIVVSVFLYRVKRELTHCFILLSAAWGVLTIVSAISDAYWGIAWAVEGLLLIAIGRQYYITSAINQGQVLTFTAVVYSWSALAMYFPLPALTSVDGWLLSLMIVAVIAIWQRLISHGEVFDQFTLNKVKPFLQFIEALWLTVLVLASANISIGPWTGALVILVQIALLFRAKSCQQVSIEVLAAALILAPLYYGYQGALLVDSYRFTLLPLFAQCALASAFLQLWLWSEFYRKYQPNSAIKHVAEAVRILFYLLIPIFWLGSVIRRFDDASLMVLWLSPLLALILAKKVNHELLLKESKVLTGLASVAFAILVGQLSLFNSLIALLGFTSFYAIAYWLNRKNAADITQFIVSWGLVALGVALANIIGSQTNSLFNALIIASLYWAVAFNAINLSGHLKRNERAIIAINLLLVAGAWLLMPSNTVYVVVPVIFLASALYQKEHKFKHSRLGTKLQLNGDLFLHSIAAVSYVILCISLAEYRMNLFIAPALAIHGALVLFLKDKRLTTVKYSFALILLGIIKLTLIDAANALLWQKVILFIGVGVFILAASFWYQKLVSTVEAR